MGELWCGRRRSLRREAMSNTVDFGIDLGTTNSAISHMTRKGAEIIPVKRQNYIPSAVALDGRGDIKVGGDAINPHLTTARGFKRLMGTQNHAAIGNGQEWSPQALSAEILKTLKSAAKLKTGDDIRDVVITVPAMFSQPQCEATHEAARLAGLNAVTLLQEPIAAATAYLSDDPVDGFYLVYDLGGGTFDVSLIRLRSGEMSVVEHGGDNYLGGSDFDRVVFDWALDQLDRKGIETSQFSSGAPRQQLLQGCEEARVSLSDEETASIYLDDFDLAIGKLEISRKVLELLIEPLVSRTIEIARDRLKHASIAPLDVRSVLLVGGPTQMPYIRARLETDLGIALSLDQDPMTVVAKGAAIHAGSILRPATPDELLPVGTAALLLSYEAATPDEYAGIAGKVTEPANFVGEVRFRSSSGDWESGWTTLRNSAFSLELMMGRGQLSEFDIELRDPSGTLVPATPPSITIRSGVRSAQPVTPYSYSVVLQGGDGVRVVVRQGVPLPASGMHDFRLAKTLLAGSEDSAVIYFVEGNSDRADENILVGSLTLKGSDLPRSLRENEQVVVTIKMDESRRLTGSVHVPVFDLDFPVTLHSVLDAPNSKDLRAAILETMHAIREIEGEVDEDESDRLLRAGRQIELLEATLDRVEKGEIGEAERIQSQLSEAKTSIRPLRDKYALKARHSELMEMARDADHLCDHFDDDLGKAKLADAREDADRALRVQDSKGLEAVWTRVNEIFWDHYTRTQDYWDGLVEFLQERTGLASDRLSYQEHVHGAQRCLREDDKEGVRLHAMRAIQLLPERERMRNRFYDSSLR